MDDSDSRNRKKKNKKVERRHICSYCSKAFAFPNKLRLHIQAAHSLSHVCEHCNTRFDRFNELRTHVAFAHHIRYKCPVCAYSSNVKAELKKHVVVNHENGVCCTVDGCNITVAYRNLKRHIREVHGKSNKDERVEHDVFRQKRLRKPSVPNKPIRLTDSSDVVRGEESSVGTSSGPSLSPHQNTEGSAPCDTTQTFEGGDLGCSAAPSSLPSLNSEPNMPTSSTQSLLPCPIAGCDKKFRRTNELSRHKIRYHKVLTAAEEAEYKYVCEYPDCNRRFRTPGGLRQHSGCHGDGILVKCDACKKTFKNRASFATHLRSYHSLSIRQVNFSPVFVSVTESVKNSPGVA